MQTVIQLFEGLAVGVGGIVLVALYFWFLYHQHQHQMRQVEQEEKQSKVKFRDALTQGVATAFNNRANVRVIGENGEAIDITYFYPQVAPHTYSPHIEIAGPSAGQIAGPAEKAYQQPALRTIVEELPHNQLAFTFGMDQANGELVQTTLSKAVHIQLIGSTGQGKSYQSTSILTQLCAGNDPEHLQLALIDCEGQTTEPFQRQPHVRYHADDPEQAARVLHNLVKELERRDQVRVIMPAMLIFVEEFLNLRRIMPAAIKDQALEDYTTLALRGKKRGMFLFSVGQTAYVEKAIRDAQNQFQSSMAFAGKPTMARAAGFTNTELLNQLWKERQPGQFLLERPAGDSLLLAPFVDSNLVPEMLTSQAVPNHFPGGSQVVPNDTQLSNGNHAGKQAEVDTARLSLVREMVEREASQNEIITAVFPGMRNSDAIAELRKYLAMMVRQSA